MPALAIDLPSKVGVRQLTREKALALVVQELGALPNTLRPIQQAQQLCAGEVRADRSQDAFERGRCGIAALVGEHEHGRDGGDCFLGRSRAKERLGLARPDQTP